MGLFYNRVAKKSPLDPTGASKWYVALRSLGLIGERELGEAITDETTLNPKEAEMAFSQLFKVMLRFLLSGNSIRLAGLGTFRLTVSCEGSDTYEEALPSKIKRVNIRFIPSESFKEALQKATFKEAKSLSE